MNTFDFFFYTVFDLVVTLLCSCVCQSCFRGGQPALLTWRAGWDTPWIPSAVCSPPSLRPAGWRTTTLWTLEVRIWPSPVSATFTVLVNQTGKNEVSPTTTTDQDHPLVKSPIQNPPPHTHTQWWNMNKINHHLHSIHPLAQPNRDQEFGTAYTDKPTRRHCLPEQYWRVVR